MPTKVKLLLIVFVAACSALGQSDSDRREAQQHYRIAMEALKDNNLPIASEELNKAADLAPSNALVRYYLGLVQSKQNSPGPALENLKRAISLGLPKQEGDLAEDLLVKLEYQARRAEVEATRATPQKLVGTYSGEIRSSDEENGQWKNLNDDDDEKTSFTDTGRTLSLNIVDGSHLTGFIRLQINRNYRFRCVGSTGSHKWHKDRDENQTQVQYFFVDLSVNAEGLAEGVQREVCYAFNNGYGMVCSSRAVTPASFRISRTGDANLTFQFGDGSSRTYTNTSSVPSSVESWVRGGAPELNPFLR